MKVESGHVYIPWETRLLSQAESSFDVLAVHGSDARRVANAFRKFRKVYPGKIMIALLGNATPHERAGVYRAGADAVYSLQSDAAVAAAWLARAVERQAHQDMLKHEEQRAKGISISKLAKLMGEARLTAFERKALSLFEAARGGVVTYTKLSRARPRGELAPDHRPISVYISRLNKKLQGFPQIKSVRDEGYRVDTSDLHEAYEYWEKEGIIHNPEARDYNVSAKNFHFSDNY
jgi:DNA-binding response OmpR family regulator